MSTVSLPVLSKQLQSVLIHDVRDAEGFLRAIGQSGTGLGGVLHHIVKLAASLPNLLHEVPLLARGVDATIVLSQLQAASLLCNAFLCQFPLPNRYLGGMNMNEIFQERNSEKLKCVIHYFYRVTDDNCTSSGLLRFHRRCLRALPRFESSSDELFGAGLTVSAKGKIEDCPTKKFIHADFANKILGGGVLGHGLVQEEIRFLICPELIVGRLFCEELTDNEVIVMTGAERFCDYDGYGYESFCFRGNHIDLSPVEGSFRVSTVVAFDAQAYKKNNLKQQYSVSAFSRELNKAYVAFFRESVEDNKPFATGNWGAGVFLGNPHLKFLIQSMAAAVAGRALMYITWEDENLASELVKLKETLSALNFTVAEMYGALASYDANSDESLFSHVLTRATQSQTQ